MNSYKIPVGVIVGLFAFNLYAQNLVKNGHFDADISDWDYNSNNATWVSNEGASISGNGSFRFGLVLNNNAYRWSASEPISVTPAYVYEVAVSVKKPAASAANFIGTQVYWFDFNDKLISQEFFTSDVTPLPEDVWLDTYAVVKAPENSVYALIRLTLSVGGIGSPDEAFALWDDVIMLEDTVFLAGFDS